MKNIGFDPKEIATLKEECAKAGQSFMYYEDEELDLSDSNEVARVHFVGEYEGKEVIYDCVIYTLALHYSSMIYEMAEKKIAEVYPSYVPIDERDENYQLDEALEEEINTLILEEIEEIEENEGLKVQEHIEIETNFDYGISLEVALYVEEITDEIIENFIAKYKEGNVPLDPTLYSFSMSDEDID